jgi:hypothetical protein
MWHVWGTREIHTGFWWGNVSERNYFEDPGVDVRVILNLVFKKYNRDGLH